MGSRNPHLTVWNGVHDRTVLYYGTVLCCTRLALKSIRPYCKWPSLPRLTRIAILLQVTCTVSDHSRLRGVLLWSRCRTPLALIQFTTQEGGVAEAHHQPLLESLEREREHPTLTRTQDRGSSTDRVVVIGQMAPKESIHLYEYSYCISVCSAELGRVTEAAQQNVRANQGVGCLECDQHPHSFPT